MTDGVRVARWNCTATIWCYNVELFSQTTFCKWLSYVVSTYLYSVHLRSKWLWVRIPLLFTLTSDIAPVSSKEFLDIQATIECRFTLKCVLGMIITYSRKRLFVKFYVIKYFVYMVVIANFTIKRARLVFVVNIQWISTVLVSWMMTESFLLSTVSDYGLDALHNSIKLISGQCTHFIPPENTRKPLKL